MYPYLSVFTRYSIKYQWVKRETPQKVDSTARVRLLPNEWQFEPTEEKQRSLFFSLNGHTIVLLLTSFVTCFSFRMAV